MALRVAPFVGIDAGLNVGVNGDVTAPTWAVDVAASRALPATAAQWDALIAAAGVTQTAPTSIYLCQDASGGLVDEIGGFNLTQAGAGHSYRQAVAGWSALAARLTDGTTGSFSTTSASLPDISTTSCMVCAVIAFAAAIPAAARNVLQLGPTAGTTAAARMNAATGFMSGLSGASAANGTTNMVDRVSIVWLKIDRTGSAAVAYSDIEVLTPTFAAGMTGKAMRLGSSGAAGGVGYLYAARWDGAAAEWSQASVKAVSQSMGWTIPW